MTLYQKILHKLGYCPKAKGGYTTCHRGWRDGFYDETWDECGWRE